MISLKRSLPNSNHRAYRLAYEWPGPLGTLPLCQKLVASPQIFLSASILEAKSIQGAPIVGNRRKLSLYVSE